MHELSLCEDILDQLTALTRRHGAKAVARVSVRIGALAGVEPMLLEHAFRSACIDTVAEQAEFRTEWVAARVRCGACGLEAETAPNDLRCPTCGGHDTELTRGEELTLASVELLVPESEADPGSMDCIPSPRGH
jgi:hydrogenase nickel incorporation protein HypA/HybF